MTSLDSRSRWLALLIVCLGDLMIVLDVTIVGVALPSIREDLGFSETSLAWVVNAYLLTFGGFLLLGGRLGDLFGHRRLFLAGIGLFTAASLACGLATSQAALIGARALQGVGGAVVSAVALSLIVTLFTEPAERAKAMGVFGFVAAGGGSIGVLLGGVLTDALTWHWIFLVNVPIGIAVVVFSLLVLPGGAGTGARKGLDVGGAVVVTASVMIPPRSTPIDPPPAATKPNTPIAFARSAGSVKSVTISDSATAETIAPPRTGSSSPASPFRTTTTASRRAIGS